MYLTAHKIIWEVGDLGVVIAFRGTASFEDAIVDVALTPHPLQLPRVLPLLHCPIGNICMRSSEHFWPTPRL